MKINYLRVAASGQVSLLARLVSGGQKSSNYIGAREGMGVTELLNERAEVPQRSSVVRY